MSAPGPRLFTATIEFRGYAGSTEELVKRFRDAIHTHPTLSFPIDRVAVTEGRLADSPFQHPTAAGSSKPLLRTKGPVGDAESSILSDCYFSVIEVGGTQARPTVTLQGDAGAVRAAGGFLYEHVRLVPVLE